MVDDRDDGRRYQRRVRLVLALIAATAFFNVAYTIRALGDGALPTNDPKAEALAAAAVGGPNLRSYDESPTESPEPTTALPISEPVTTAMDAYDVTKNVSLEPEGHDPLESEEKDEREPDDEEPGRDGDEPKGNVGVQPKDNEEQEEDDDDDDANGPREPKEYDGRQGNPNDEQDPAKEAGDEAEPASTDAPQPTITDELSADDERPEREAEDSEPQADGEPTEQATTVTPEPTSDPFELPPVTSRDSIALSVHYTAKQQALPMEKAWAEINGPLIEIRHYSDNASRDLVAQHRPHFLEIYDKQLSPVERADYFRYLVLWVFGGLYIDSDINFVRPVDQWLKVFGWDPRDDGWRLLETIDLIVGVEFPSPQTGYGDTGWLPLQLTQFVIAGAKGSPVLERILDHVEVCVRTVDRRGDVERTLQRTGPAAFTRAILNEIEFRGLPSEAIDQAHEIYKSDERYPRALLPTAELEKNGQLIPLRVEGDTGGFNHILVLPYRAFGYYPSHKLAKEAVLTRHLFHNSWRHKNGQHKV